MMFNDVCESMYRYIIEAEIDLLRFFKIDSIEFVNKMTFIDLQTYLNEIDKRNKKDKDSINKKDLEKAFVQLRDILLFITLGKEGTRLRL